MLWEIIFGGLLIWTSKLLFEVSVKIEYDLLSLIIIPFGIYAIIVAILQFLRREVLVIDNYGVRVIPNYFKESVVLRWQEILYIELIRKSNVKFMIFSLKDGQKIQIVFTGISSWKSKESIEFMKKLMNEDPDVKDMPKVDIESSTISSSGVLLVWLLFQTVAGLLAWVHMLIYSEVIFKGNMFSPFFTLGIMSAVFLIVTDFNYWFLFKLGWHSTEEGIKFTGPRGSVQFPAFISNSADYLNRRNSISSRAKYLQKIYVATRIILISFLIGGASEAIAFMMSFNLKGYFSITVVIVVAILLIIIFTMYKQFFAKIFKLKIIQSENSRPHFDDI
ncbi:hypothetical protein [Companilactobacillus keshanensis]|uniref:PH domain-containing protein n=1 Tax=Companilactobacillus keshanensis TaxID=2486003 RepID=A0ABW4BSB7_9LACO|nr:hypothetical protein [Companilactobacillus keshanensis]